MSYITQRLRLLAIVCAVACFSASAAASQSWFSGIDESRWSGITGQVRLYNPYVFTRPTNTNAGPWRAGSITPFYASFRVYSAGNGKLVTSFVTHASGRFRLSLPPGHYRVVPETMYGGQVLPPQMIVIGHTQVAPPFNVRVRPFRFITLKVMYQESMGY